MNKPYIKVTIAISADVIPADDIDDSMRALLLKSMLVVMKDRYLAKYDKDEVKITCEMIKE